MMELIDATCTAVANKFTTCPVYISNSQEFKRPSFYIYLSPDNRTPANKILNNINVTINIMYFAPKDDYDNPDIENGFLVLDELNNLFAGMKLHVNDRYYSIKKTTGGNYQDEIVYSITIDYFDYSPQEIENYDKMQHVDINYK